MVDKFTKKVRAKIMSSIKSKNTWPEKEARSYLHRHGYRFVLHDKRLPGKPDIVLPKYKTVVEVNGCFWHGHKCKGSGLPSTNKKFWEKKINNNNNQMEITYRMTKEIENKNKSKIEL